MAGQLPPAGWYPNNGRMRWWDGRVWTDHVLEQKLVQAAGQGSSKGSTKDERPLYKKKRFIIPVAFVALIVVSSGLIGSSEDAPIKVEVAQFIGQTPDDAHNQLEDMLDAEMTTDYDDFSPRGRDVNRYEDVIVAADRKVVTADHPEIRFWTLTPRDMKWFDGHPTMPKVRIGSKCESQYGADAFEPVNDLVFVATKPGTKRAPDASKIKSSYEFKTDQQRWPTSLAELQRSSVGSLWEAQDNSYPPTSVIQGQSPKAGQKLRLGQLLVIYCSSTELDESDSSDTNLPIPPVPNNKDDDFDFPDRLCPTRFC